MTDLEELKARHAKAEADIQNNFGAAYSSRIEQDSYSIHQDRGWLITRLESAEREQNHWKANHDHIKARIRLLLDRPDLPQARKQMLDYFDKKLASAERVVEAADSYVVAELEPSTNKVCTGLFEDLHNALTAHKEHANAK